MVCKIGGRRVYLWRAVDDEGEVLDLVPNAIEQAKQAASAIVGRPRPPGETPWQWSDQYDIKLQIAGYPFDVDRIIMRAAAVNRLDAGRFARVKQEAPPCS